MGPETSATRTALLDAVEAVMSEDGYAAVTSRRVAGKAGLKQQLLYYYFLTMDDLLLATFRRSSGRMYRRLERALRGDRPLHALLKLMSMTTTRSILSMEYMSLGNHNPAIQAEIVKFSEQVRRLQIEAVSAKFKPSSARSGIASPVLAVFVMHCISQILHWEAAIGMSAGHEEGRAYLERLVDELEPDAVPRPQTQAGPSG
jgi:AcrR family transcriptional regulator